MTFLTENSRIFLEKLQTLFFIKSRDTNRLPIPGTDGIGSGYGGYNYYEELLAAIRGVDIRRKKLDIHREAGDYRLNSVVSICINWIATSWQAAPAAYGRRSGAKVEGTGENHPLLRLLRRPNGHTRGNRLVWQLLSDWYATGNAYCHIVTDGATNRTGMPVELHWLPARYMEPRRNYSTGQLSHYQYQPGNGVGNGGAQGTYDLDPSEVIHFRFGVQAENPLLGCSPLLAQAAYIVADNAGAQYGAGLLHHGGLPPAVLVPDHAGIPQSPMGGPTARALDKDTATRLSDELSEKMQTEPGKVPFIGNAVKLVTLGYKPSEMALNELMEMPESRIPAAFGIPPEVLKLRLGMSHSTENNIAQSRAAAWEDCIIPVQDIFAEEWTEELLLPRYGVAGNHCIYYDRTEVGVLQPDKSAERQDAATLYAAGIIDRAEAKAMCGEMVTDADKGVYAASAAAASPEDPEQDNS